MLVCLATYGDRLAAVLDNATELRFFEVRKTPEGRKSEPRGTMLFPGVGASSLGGQSWRAALADALIASGARTLLCGAISEQTAQSLAGAGVRVEAWLGASVETALRAYLKGDLASVALPGNRRPRRAAPKAEEEERPVL